MYVVIVGPRERVSAEDEKMVAELLEQLKKKYGISMLVISTACDKGIGGYVKQLCLKNTKDFRFLEVTQRIYADLPRSRMFQIFISRNAWLAEVGDEFHVFVDSDKKVQGREDTMDNLLNRLGYGTDNPRLGIHTYEPGQVIQLD